GAANAAMRLGLMDGAADFERTGERRVGLAAVGAEGDARAGRVAAILVFERTLDRAQVHGNGLRCTTNGGEDVCRRMLCYHESGSTQGAPIAADVDWTVWGGRGIRSRKLSFH